MAKNRKKRQAAAPAEPTCSHVLRAAPAAVARRAAEPGCAGNEKCANEPVVVCVSCGRSLCASCRPTHPHPASMAPDGRSCVLCCVVFLFSCSAFLLCCCSLKLNLCVVCRLEICAAPNSRVSHLQCHGRRGRTRSRRAATGVRCFLLLFLVF